MTLKSQIVEILITILITAVIVSLISSFKIEGGKFTFKFEFMDVVGWTLLLSGMVLMTSYAHYKGRESMKKEVIELLEKEKEEMMEAMEEMESIIKEADPEGFEKYKQNSSNDQV